MVFESVPESTGCSLRPAGLLGIKVDDAQVGACRDCFVGSFLGGDVFHVRGEVDGLAYPLHWPTVYSCQPRGYVLPVRHHPVLSLLIGGGTCRGEEASRGIVIWRRVCPLRYLSYIILHTVNDFYKVVLIP
jgi:hypothetical protein